MSLVVVILIVADNIEASKNEMLDYLQYDVRNYGKYYRTEIVETTLEFTPNIKMQYKC